MQRRCYRSNWFSSRTPSRRLALVVFFFPFLPLPLPLFHSPVEEEKIGEEKNRGISEGRGREQRDKVGKNGNKRGKRRTFRTRHSARSPPSSPDTFYPPLFRLFLIAAAVDAALTRNLDRRILYRLSRDDTTYRRIRASLGIPSKLYSETWALAVILKRRPGQKVRDALLGGILD